MKYNKLTYQGPATSLSAHGAHFRRAKPVYLTDAELPLALTELRSLGVKCESVEADERPESVAENLDEVAAGTVGIVWKGMSPRKTNDWGTFIRDEPRFDIPVDAVRYLQGRAGWQRVER